MQEALELGQVDRILESDIEFHLALIEAADHTRLLDIWNGLVGPLRILLGLTARRASDELRSSQLGHEQIYEAVKLGDPDLTITRLSEHLEAARTMVLGYLRAA